LLEFDYFKVSIQNLNKMTMLAGSPLLAQADHSLLGFTEDFSSYFDQAADSLLINTQNWFDTLLDERNEFCSTSSSACPSVTSELCDFDALMNDSFTQESQEHIQPAAEPDSILCLSPSKSNFHSKKNKKNTPNRTTKWSSLSTKEKTATLQDLMETVSQKLGLREQLEIIKIIDPNARLNPTDTEFFIDFDLMDDRKYDLVQLYVEKELRRYELSKTKEKKSSHKTTDTILKQKRTIEKRKEIIKKTEKLKAFRQIQKERRSGLFSREQVIAMASFTVTETESLSDEEEIDILS